MRKALIAVLMIAGIVAVAYAGKDDTLCVLKKEPTATGPIGAVVECCGVFVGKIASAVEISATGERKLTVENETGECRVFPFCKATKIVDGAFHGVTGGKLKAGQKVKVEYQKEGSAETAKTVTVEE